MWILSNAFSANIKIIAFFFFLACRYGKLHWLLNVKPTLHSQGTPKSLNSQDCQIYKNLGDLKTTNRSHTKHTRATLEANTFLLTLAYEPVGVIHHFIHSWHILEEISVAFLILRGHFIPNGVPVYLRFYLFLERGKRREISTWERNVDWLRLVCAPTADWAHNPGMCPDQESNWRLRHVYERFRESWTFALLDNAQPVRTKQRGF